jgi:hypothetical protein
MFKPDQDRQADIRFTFYLSRSKNWMKYEKPAHKTFSTREQKKDRKQMSE